MVSTLVKYSVLLAFYERKARFEMLKMTDIYMQFVVHAKHF